MKKSIAFFISIAALAAVISVSSCKSNKEVIVPTQTYQFLITLVEGINIQKVLSKYDEYAIAEVKPVSKSKNMHMFKITSSEQQKEVFLTDIRTNAKVISIGESRTSPNPPTKSTNVQSGKTKPIRQ